MFDFARKFALIAAAVLVPVGLALGALAISSETGAPPVRVDEATVQMHTPAGEQGRSSSPTSSSSSDTSTSPTTTTTTPPAPAPAPVPVPAPAQQPIQSVQPVVPYYGGDWNDDWDDDDGAADDYGDDDWDD